MQHHPAHRFDIACAGEPSDWLYSVETQSEQGSERSHPGKRFWLFFSMPGGSWLSVALTHRDHRVYRATVQAFMAALRALSEGGVRSAVQSRIAERRPRA